MSKYGYKDSNWDIAKQEAVDILGDYANRRQMIPYSEFVPYITAVRFDGPHDPRLFQVNSNCKCTTSDFPEHFMGSPISEALSGAIV